MTDVYVDCFKNAPPEFFEITSHALDALWYVDMTIDKESMMSLIYKVHDIECKLSDFSSRFYVYLIAFRETKFCSSENDIEIFHVFLSSKL